MMKNNYYIAIAFLLVVATLYISMTSLYAEDEYPDLPDVEAFSAGAGATLNLGIDNPQWIGGIELNGDGKTDLLISDKNNYLHTAANVTDSTAVEFMNIGTAFRIDGNIDASYGTDLDGDGDTDIMFGLSGDVMPVFTEQVGVISTISSTMLTDNTANWRQNELAGMTLKLDPQSSNPREFTITANGGIGVPPEENPYNIPEKTILVEGGGLSGSPGDYYGYQRGQSKMSSPTRVEVYLNDGNGALTLSPCQGALEIPAGRLIDSIGAADFDGDGIMDIAVEHTRYIEGQVSDVNMTVTGFPDLSGKGRDFIDGARDGEDFGDIEDDLEILITFTDNQASFEDYAGNKVNPNITQNEFFEIIGNTDQTITFSFDMASSLGDLAGGYKLDALARPGTTYRVKVGDSKFELFKGKGDGCYQSLDVISGENYQIDFEELDIGGVVADRSVIYAPNVNLGLADALADRLYNPSVETPNSGPYPIESNTDTTITIAPGAGDLRAYRGDTFMILADTGIGNVDASSFATNELVSTRIPAEYTTLGVDMRDIGPPYRGTVIDIDGTGGPDIVFIANGIFYKLQQ